MIAGRRSRPRPRRTFSSSWALLESRALLSVAAGVADVAAARRGPTVAVDEPYAPYDSRGFQVAGSSLYFQGPASSLDARVEVYAAPRRGAAILIGQTEVDADGYWRLGSDVTLADGLYAIRARAVDLATGLAGPFATMASKLDVDHVGPRIIDARIQPERGRITLVFRDFGGYRNVGAGLMRATVEYPPSFAFAPTSAPWPGPTDPRWETTGVDVSPAGRDGVQRVVVTINDGAPIPDGSYRLYVQSPGPVYPEYGPPYYVHVPFWALGVTDEAGNQLDGAATSTIPAPDSNDYAAAFVVSGGGASRPGPVVSPRWRGLMRG